jgi:hypothetical protein
MTGSERLNFLFPCQALSVNGEISLKLGKKFYMRLFRFTRRMTNGLSLMHDSE